MKLYVDPRSIRHFRLVSRNSDHGDVRRYYVANRDLGRLMFVVCRNGTSLERLAGERVDANVGYEAGVRGFVRDEDVGKRHTKLTIYRTIDAYAPRTLSDIIDGAQGR